MKTKTVTVHMHCHSCETIITDALKELPGINNIAASATKNSVSVTYDEKKVTEKRIMQTIIDEGYAVQ